MAGSQIASTIDARIFQICLAVVMVMVLVFTLLGNKLFKGSGEEILKITPLHYFVFFLIGVYNGYVNVGSGYLMLLASMGLMHQGIVGSNIMKNFILLIAIPFSLIVFIIHGHIDWTYGLIHGIGNVIGAYVASRFAMGWGVKFLRGFLIAIVLVCLADVTGLISIRDFVLAIVS
jgi:uncharacterized membrane protein YfcA